MDTPHGTAWYLGSPGTGKTSLAWAHLRDMVSRDRYPAIIIDPIGSEQFRTTRLAASVDDVVRTAWKERQSVRFVPSDETGADLDAICSAAAAGGCVHLLVDESAFYLNSRRGVFSPLPRLLRGYRHARVTVQLTTQHPSGDVSQEALACSPNLYVFRTNSPRALDMLEREYGIPRNDILSLPLPEVRQNGITCHFVAIEAGGTWRKTAEDLTF